MTPEQIIDWAKKHHAMIHFWRQIVVFVTGYKHTTGETLEEAVYKMQAQMEQTRKQRMEQVI